MDNLQAGDVLENDDYGYERIVQGTIGEAIITVSTDDYTAQIDSVVELKHRDWKLKSNTQDTTRVLTMQEVADKFGEDVNNIRIKK